MNWVSLSNEKCLEYRSDVARVTDVCMTDAGCIEEGTAADFRTEEASTIWLL